VCQFLIFHTGTLIFFLIAVISVLLTFNWLGSLKGTRLLKPAPVIFEGSVFGEHT